MIFKRLSASMMIAAIASIQRSDLNQFYKDSQIRSLGNYHSRGHGGKTPRTFSGVAKARRAAKQARRAH